MKLAFANAGMWFFGAIIIVVVFTSSGSTWNNEHDVIVNCLTIVAIAFVVAGARFFYVWHEYEQGMLHGEETQSKADDPL